MEKAVVRRGIGAVVLALVAALLLGYLLKGKAPERKDVVSMELPKSPIQIFPENKEGTETADGTAQNVASGVAAAGAGAVAAGAAVAGKTADGAKEAGKAVADSGKKLVGTTGDTVGKVTDKIVDPVTGNPSSSRKNIVVDGAGQVVYGTKEAGPKDAPAKFDFRTTAGKEVRPSVDGKATLAKVAPTKTAPKSNAKLVGEKKLPPVGAKVAASSTSSSKKIASSRNSQPAAASKKKQIVATTKKQAAPAAAAPTGRNKYVVQLLATSNSGKANSLRNTMMKEGYAAFVSTAKSGGKTLYRVRVGGFAGKSAAIQKQNAMKRRYRQNQFVQSSIVVRN